ncbi:hypothetical protein [Ruminiclostridium papyrosolvens]|uniref:Uncharacterized protein n=1 Tax=Ruminiclostridium papyrosolvens C7 TaxID=1330534 RepID=U4R3P9_9FIRM|nr:hypothetical protein [Ruminiclostridium papyrosolvens]EPR13028.1 hypothetical protein L323_06825 [Ruminiclostridium papyrosolvens C7]
MKKMIVTMVTILVLTVCLTAIVIANSHNNNTNTTVSPTISDNIINTLVKNPNFQNHGFEIRKMFEAVKIDKKTAIELAKKVVGEKQGQKQKIFLLYL